MKRVCLILVAMALLVCSLAVPVTASETDFATFNFSVTRITCYTPYGTFDPMQLRSVLYNAYFTNSAVITSCSSAYVFGYFWDECGRLSLGVWENGLGVANASVLGVFPQSSLTFVESGLYSGNSSGRYLYFSKALAEQQDEFLTSEMYALYWGSETATSAWFGYFKSKNNSAFNSTISNFSLVMPEGGVPHYNVATRYRPASDDAILWNVVPEGGTPSGSGGSGDFDPSADPYIYVSIPTTVTKGLYIIPRAELMNPGDIPGNILCFLSGHNSAYTKLTESDSLDNMWTLDCGRDETASTLTLTFMVEGRPDIYTTCIVSVVGSQTDNEGSSGNLPGAGDTGDDQEENDSALGEIQEGITSLPGKILDGIVGLFVPDADAMAAQQEKWTQLLADRFGAVYEAGEIVTDITDVFTLQDTQTQIQFPSVTIPFGDVDWTFGGWMVDVVPDGFEFLIEILKKILDIVCTLAFVNAMKNRFDRVLEEKT